LLFADFLEFTGKDVKVYTGKHNFALLTQKLLPAGSIKFLQENTYKNEVKLILPLPASNQVKGVRWDQDQKAVEILIELSEGLEQTPEMQVVSSMQFDEVWLMGNIAISWVEGYKQFSEHVNLEGAELNKIILTDGLQSLSEVAFTTIEKHFQENNDVQRSQFWNKQRVRRLITGSLWARKEKLIHSSPLSTEILNLIVEKQLEVETESFITAALQELQIEGKTWNGFLQFLSKGEYQEQTELQSLFQLLPEFVPARYDFEGNTAPFQYEYNGKSSKLVYTNNLKFRPEKDARWDFRRMDKFLLARIYETIEKTAQPEIQVEEKAIEPVINTDKPSEQAEYIPLQPVNPQK
jgi:hypothetical protein